VGALVTGVAGAADVGGAAGVVRSDVGVLLGVGEVDRLGE
jgi:hypothetical protein